MSDMVPEVLNAALDSLFTPKEPGEQEYQGVDGLLYCRTQHPNYKLTAGADKKNTFSIEAFLDHRLKLKPGDKYEVVDADHAK